MYGKYAKRLQFATTRIKSSYHTYYTVSNNKNNNYINGQNSTSVITMTDVQINTVWSSCRDKNTSKQNCDLWLNFSNVSAVQYTRSILVPNVGYCDVPNINTLLRMRVEADYLDLMDPTIWHHRSQSLCSRQYFPSRVSSTKAGSSAQPNSPYIADISGSIASGTWIDSYLWVNPVIELVD